MSDYRDGVGAARERGEAAIASMRAAQATLPEERRDDLPEARRRDLAELEEALSRVAATSEEADGDCALLTAADCWRTEGCATRGACSRIVREGTVRCEATPPAPRIAAATSRDSVRS